MLRKMIWTAAAVVALSTPVFAASGADGWPVAEAPKPAARAAAQKPAEKPAASDVKAVVQPKPAPKAAPVAAVVKPKPAPAALPAVDSSELSKLLLEQSKVMASLAAKLDEQKRVIDSQQSAIQALEKKNTPPAAVAAPAAAAGSAAAAAPPPPITVDTGGMKIRIAGLFQGWYSGGDNGAINTFRLRRTELKVSGDFGKRAKWTFMIDPAKALSLTNTTSTIGGQTVVTGATVAQNSKVLQDAYLSLIASPALTVDLGQQKIPLGYEGTISSGKLDMIERSLFVTDKTRGGGWGDARDLGVMVKGKLAGGTVEYFGGLFDGLGEAINDVDKNEQKDVVGRFIFHPKAFKGVQIGASFARDAFQTTEATLRTRQAVEMMYAHSTFSVKAEGITGWDGLLERHGGYVQVADQVTKSFQMLFRFDMWDPDMHKETAADNVTERDWIGGFTYNVKNTPVQMQFNYIRKTFGGVSPDKNVFMANLQTNF